MAKVAKGGLFFRVFSGEEEEREIVAFLKERDRQEKDYGNTL